jgi:hypothetical protein
LKRAQYIANGYKCDGNKCWKEVGSKTETKETEIESKEVQGEVAATP